MLRDFDNDANCPGELIGRLVRSRHACLCLRLAVRQVEAWLLADWDALATALAVPGRDLPSRPEVIVNGKRELVDKA